MTRFLGRCAIGLVIALGGCSSKTTYPPLLNDNGVVVPSAGGKPAPEGGVTDGAATDGEATDGATDGGATDGRTDAGPTPTDSGSDAPG